MSYTLRFSDPTTNTTIVVPSKSVSSAGINDYDTSLQLVGSGYQNYGLPTAQNFLKLLENFSGPVQPNNSIKGQLWYDTSNASRPILRINNGTNTSGRWPSANGIYQQSSDPSITYTGIRNGDVWIDTGNNLLKIRFDSSWTIVGPNIESGPYKTGSETIKILANDDLEYPIIATWANGIVIHITSSNTFTPKSVISGFPTIKIGTNLNSKIISKYNGLAERASALEISPGITLGPNNLLKNNVTSQVHTGTLYVETTDGLYVRLSRTGNAIKLYTDSINNGYVNYYGETLQVGTQNTAYLKFNSGYTSIGINKSPSSDSPALDVYGGGRFTGSLTISSTSSALSVLGDAAVGGRLSSKDMYITGNTTSTGKITVGLLGNGVIIEPAINDVYDIGSTYRKFRTLYVSEIIGTTQYSGNITGSAASLATPRAFNIQGQVTATSVTFNGTSPTNFVTSLTRNSISDHTTIYTAHANYAWNVVDISNPNAGLEKITKASFLSDVYALVFQTGMITPFSTSTNIPSGFLVCNGQSTSTTLYPALYAIIGASYGNAGAGTFRVPNMSTTTLISGSTYLTYLIKT